MADLCPIGANSIHKGDLLIATPKLQSMPWRKSVIFVTEAREGSVMGTILNRPTMMTTDDVTDVPITRTQIYMGGPIETHALFMLHTEDFSSSNTLHITDSWCVSSDTFMFDKLGYGQEPVWYRFYMGAAGWHTAQLQREIDHGAWMIINNPTFDLVTEDATDQWQTCVDSVSQKMFSSYI
jgi:putative transcriptional regulator